MANETIYLGSGIEHPIRIDEYGKVAMISGVPLVKQSIRRLLSTAKRTKYFLPEFGTRLNEMLFQGNNEYVRNMLYSFVVDCIKDWEKRVRIDDVTFETDPQNSALLYIKTKYRILPTNEIDTFIFPFYTKNTIID